MLRHRPSPRTIPSIPPFSSTPRLRPRPALRFPHGGADLAGASRRWPTPFQCLARRPARQTGSEGLAGGDVMLLDGWSGVGEAWVGAADRKTASRRNRQDSDIWTLSMGDGPPASATGSRLAVSRHRHRWKTRPPPSGPDRAIPGRSTSRPTANFKLNDWLSADVSLGYGYADADQVRQRVWRTGYGGPMTVTLCSGRAANLTASKWSGAWLMSGRSRPEREFDQTPRLRGKRYHGETRLIPLNSSRAGSAAPLASGPNPCCPISAPNTSMTLTTIRPPSQARPMTGTNFASLWAAIFYGTGDNQKPTLP